jgi:hypothetical protein
MKQAEAASFDYNRLRMLEIVGPMGKKVYLRANNEILASTKQWIVSDSHRTGIIGREN